MTTRSTHLLDRLESHRAEVAVRLDALPEEVVHAAPSPGAWSLAQIADHLVRIDEKVRPEGPTPSRLVRLTSRARGSLMAGVISLPVRFPMPPNVRGIRPDAAPRWPDIRDRWAEMRRRWHAADPPDATVAFRHPIVGPLAWPDTLAFLLAHHRHHDAQIERTLRALGHA